VKKIALLIEGFEHGIAGTHIALKTEASYMAQGRLITFLVILILSAPATHAKAWNIPSHMLHAAITHQVLLQENPQTIEKVKAVLEQHPWYANQWQARVQDVSVAERNLALFMPAARWPDDIRTQDKAQNRPPWHYINLPFKPEGQPPSVQIREPARSDTIERERHEDY
jgi:hypothetical protein